MKNRMKISEQVYHRNFIVVKACNQDTRERNKMRKKHEVRVLRIKL